MKNNSAKTVKRLFFDTTGEDFQKGKEDALNDIEANKLKIKSFGKKRLWFGEWKKLLLDEYKIEVEIVAGCVTSEDERNYAVGYNEISAMKVKEKFGKDFFDKTQEKSQQIWESKPKEFYELFPENENPEMKAVINQFDWVKCPNCNKSFKIYSEVSWNGKYHLSCGQKLKIIKK